MSALVKQSTRVVTCMLLLLFATTSVAQNKVVVIPMSGDDLKPLSNIVTVAKQNGDFTDPVAAMASITATAADPYLLVIAPGVYSLGNQQLVMKEYVEVAGSGQNATILTGGVSGQNATAALVVGANNAGIRDLTIENISGGASNSSSTGIYNGTASPFISDITIKVSTGGLLTGIHNSNSSPTISLTTINVFDADAPKAGIFNEASSSPSVSNSKIVVSGGTSTGYGILNSTASATVSDTIISVSGPNGSQTGVSNSNSSSSVIIRGCSISSSSFASVDADEGSGVNESYISDSSVSGGIDGDPKCSFTFDESGDEYDSNCNLPT